jgi:FkbM family methyltransferase
LKAAAVDLVLDVGANIGQTGRAQRTAGYHGRIISFEPIPAALSKTAAKDPFWTVAPPMAIGDRDGEITMNISEATDLSSVLEASDELLKTLPRTKVREQVTVASHRLDSIVRDLLAGASSVFLKIDTQGFERSVLNGAPETLALIRVLQMELSLYMIVETNFSKTCTGSCRSTLSSCATERCALAHRRI